MSWRWERHVLRRVVIEFLPEAQKAHYLDFACGTGRVLAFLEGDFGHATGVDVSPAMLEVARRKVRSARLVRADITSEAVFERAQFDLVTAFRFFARAEPDLRCEVMRELHKLLRPHGYLVFNNHRNCTSLSFRLQRLRGYSPVCWHERDVLNLCRETGFEVVKVYHWGIIPRHDHDRKRILPEYLQYPLEQAIVATGLVRSLATHQVYACCSLN